MSRHRWERSAFMLRDEATGTSALAVRLGEIWEWAVIDADGKDCGKGEAANESLAKGDAGKAFDAAVKAWTP